MGTSIGLCTAAMLSMAILLAGLKPAGWSTGGAPGTKGTRLGMSAMLASPGTCMKYVHVRRTSEQQAVQRVGEGSQVWICKISMDCCSKGGCVVSPENNVSITQQVREGHHCCNESEQFALIDLRLQVASWCAITHSTMAGGTSPPQM